MELWIRSQSRQTLIKAVKIFTENEEVYATTNSELDERIGVYETKERALEVLDNIQGHIKLKYLYEEKEYEALKIMIDGADEIKASNNMIVYEMPQE